MNTMQPGADAAGYMSPSADGPIHTGRGLYRWIAIVTAVMMLVGGFALMPMGARAASVEATQDLNLRAEPVLNAEILDVITTGSSVEITGDAGNGFYSVSYQGQSGYAYGYYLTVGSTGSGSVNTDGNQGEVYVTNGPVNFRTGPSESDSVISIIPDGALVALTGDSANGYLSIIYTDRSGWAYGASVTGSGEEPVAPEDPAATEEPTAPEEPVATEEPAAPETPEEDASAPVETPESPDDEDSAPVATEEPASDETVPVGDSVTGSGTVINGSLNLRAGPGTDYEVVEVMPGNAWVQLRGEAQGNYYPVSFAGVSGWASADFLQIGGDEPAAPEEGATETEEPAAPTPTEPPAPEPTEPPATEAPAPEPTEPPATEAPADPPADGSDGYTEDEIIQIIYNAADAYGQPREDMLRVARCESVLDPNAVNSASNASGLFQFLPSTWETTPYADENIFDPVASANAAAWMWDNGRRNEWVCQ